MRRRTSALALGILVASLVSTPAAAKADKLDLTPASGLPGRGAVVLNNSAGLENLEVTVQLKGVPADSTFDMYLFIDGGWYGGAPVGTIITNREGNATFHMNAQVTAGDHLVAFDVALPVSGADQYFAPPSSVVPWGILMTFK